ncbi:MAG: metallophosphoesterase family protein [Elusimicrobiota bacterium]
MIHAVISDIHSNYEAFSEVLNFLGSKSVSSYLICGDIIGYGPQPIECIKAVRELGDKAKIVLGNHDAVLAGKMDIKWFNDYARKSIEITKERIDKDTVEWFCALPEKIDLGKILIVHGSPKSPLKEYLLSEIQYSDNLENLKSEIVFFGHTHIPMCFCKDENGKNMGDFIKPFARIKINDKGKFFINPGSVGQPRDGNSMASFGLFDDEKMVFELIRIDYDVKKVQKLMKEINMPQLLIERLDMGY